MALSRLLDKASRRPTGVKTAQMFTYPAPVDGLNKNNNITDMKISEALVLENLVCREGAIALRYGYTDSASAFSTGTPASIYTWMPSPYGVNEVYFVANNGVYSYNFSTTSWVTKASIGTSNNGFMMAVWFSTTTDTFLVCNAGTTTGIFTYSPSTGYVNRDATITHGSFDSTQCVGLGLHAERLFMWENDNVLYYLPVASIAGGLTELPLGPFLNKGGTILGVKSWTRDGGDGLDDYFCIFTTNGEVIIYQGYDPDDPDNWQKVGTFDIGQPLTQTPGLFARHVMKVGGDIGVLTKRGLAMLSQLAQTNESGHKKISVTYRISAEYQRAVDYTTTTTLEAAWAVCEYPRENLILVNCPNPDASGVAQQLVMNVNTSGWSKWTGIPVERGMMCVDLVEGKLRMFSTAAKALSYDTGAYRDDGVGIPWKMQTAFSTLKTMLNKNVSMVRPHLYGSGIDFFPIVEIKSNFDPSGFNSGSGQRTDLGLSDNVGDGTAYNNMRWASCPAEGVAFSVCLSGTSGEEMTINAIDVLYEISDIL